MSKAHKKAYKKKLAKRKQKRFVSNALPQPRQAPAEPQEENDDDQMQGGGGDYEPEPPQSPPQSASPPGSASIPRLRSVQRRRASSRPTRLAAIRQRGARRTSCSRAGLALRMCPGSGKGPVR